jgi:hypothetical protein
MAFSTNSSPPTSSQETMHVPGKSSSADPMLDSFGSLGPVSTSQSAASSRIIHVPGESLTAAPAEEPFGFAHADQSSLLTVSHGIARVYGESSTTAPADDSFGFEDADLSSQPTTSHGIARVYGESSTTAPSDDSFGFEDADLSSQPTTSHGIARVYGESSTTAPADESFGLTASRRTPLPTVDSLAAQTASDSRRSVSSSVQRMCDMAFDSDVSSDSFYLPGSSSSEYESDESTDSDESEDHEGLGLLQFLFLNILQLVNLFPHAMGRFDREEPRPEDNTDLSLKSLNRLLENSSESVRREICVNKSISGHRFQVDYFKSRVPLAPQDIEITTDVDSVLCTFHQIPEELDDVRFNPLSLMHIQEQTHVFLRFDAFKNGIALEENELEEVGDVCLSPEYRSSSWSQPRSSSSSSNQPRSSSSSSSQPRSSSSSSSQPRSSSSSSSQPRSSSSSSNQPRSSSSSSAANGPIAEYRNGEDLPRKWMYPISTSRNLLIGLHTIQNYCIASSGEGKLFILFPRCRRKSQGFWQTIPFGYDYENFYNLVLLRAFNEVGLRPSAMPLSYELAKHRNEATKSYPLSGRTFRIVMSRAREIVDLSEDPRIRIFKGFFFNLQFAGIKDLTRLPIDENDSLLQELFRRIPLLRSRILQNDRYQSVYIDVGFEYGAENQDRAMTMLWDGKKIFKAFDQLRDYHRPEKHLYVKNPDVYGIRVKVKDRVRYSNPEAPVFMQLYFCDKGPNYRRLKNGDSSILAVQTFFKHNDRRYQDLDDLRKAYDEMCNLSFNVRYEARIKISEYVRPDLIQRQVS